MSLVGPRPVIPELTTEFHWSYERLLAVRPGLTDPATMKYCREVEILALVPDPLQYFKMVVVPDKLRISRAYLQRATPWSDLVVLMRTAIALLPSANGARLEQLGTEPSLTAHKSALRAAIEANRGT
jgi:lipopolysaccharide/colanic/teichoic acid biosynthesis glycosyltransferase